MSIRGTEGDALATVSDALARTEEASLGDAATQAGQPHRRKRATLVSEGDELGRYRVGDTLGEGGMGAVVSAYDSDLDRQVAVKLLHPSGSGHGDSGEEARRRLLREARAMAKVRHPNVITVYEVGEDHGHVFIAMEYVDGGTLRDWMAAEHSWRETLLIFLPIARALAAAHDVGLVHRDIKPENVLITKDGTPIVTDFGLASATAAVIPDSSRISGSSDALEVTMSHSGAVLGTPAYMSAEQHLGDDADPRADQFAFSVMLWEALYGIRPFAGKTVAEVRRNVVAGELSALSRDVGLPATVDRALQRGLSREAGERFESMTDLVKVIEGVLSRRSVFVPRPVAPAPEKRRGITVFAIVSTVLFLLLAGYTFKRDGSSANQTAAAEPCAKVEHKMALVWTPSVRGAIEAAFMAAKAEAGANVKRVTDAMDAYSKKWSALRHDVCETTLVKEQATELYERQVTCFERGLGQFRALAQQLPLVEARIQNHAVVAVLGLPDISACTTPFQAPSHPLPDAYEKRQQLTRLRHRLDDTRAIMMLGRLSLPTLERLVEEAEATGHPPLVAEAFELVGQAYEHAGLFAKAEGALRRGVLAATHARDDILLAQLQSNLVFVVGVQLGRGREADALAAETQALLERRGNPPLPLANLLSHWGEVKLDALGDAELGIKYSTRALELRREVLPANHPAIVLALSRLGRQYKRNNDPKSAARSRSEALDLLQSTLGHRHEQTEQMLSCVADIDTLRSLPTHDPHDLHGRKPAETPPTDNSN